VIGPGLASDNIIRTLAPIRIGPWFAAPVRGLLAASVLTKSGLDLEMDGRVSCQARIQRWRRSCRGGQAGERVRASEEVGGPLGSPDPSTLIMTSIDLRHSPDKKMVSHGIECR
jgi:hypothetical protein